MRQVLASFVLALAACGGSEPAAPPTAPSAAPEAPVEAPVEPTAASSADAQAPPVDTLTPAPGTEGEKVELVPPADASKELALPSFATLIGEGPSVTLTVRIEGADRGELAFQAIQDGRPQMLHVEIVEGRTELQIQAPASWPQPVYVAFAVAAASRESGPEAQMGLAAGTPARDAPVRVGGADQAITLAGQDLAVDVVVDDSPPEWLKMLATQGPVPYGGQAPGASPQGG